MPTCDSARVALDQFFASCRLYISFTPFSSAGP